MPGFNYTYLDSKEIFERINYLSQDIFPGLIFVILIIIFIYVSNNYIFPAILFSIENYKLEKKKKQRKNLLKQIQLQREVEDEIEKNL